jgi:hypothetical protein
MYVILCNDDDTLYGSHKERIMQRSKLVDELVFVVNPIYRNKHDMTNASVVLEYLLPVSRKYETEYLVLSDERYGDCFLQYKLPLDTKITSEAGTIELQLTFAYTDLDEKGNGIQRVRKTSTTTVEIVPISAWSDIIPDSALSSLDQRILKIDSQMRALNDLANVLDGNTSIVDNLVYDDASSTLQLSANGVGVGDKVSVKDMLDEGTPIVDLDTKLDDKPSEDEGSADDDDNVVEF